MDERYVFNFQVKKVKLESSRLDLHTLKSYPSFQRQEDSSEESRRPP